MADGPKIGDAASLWNFSPSPGWTKDEVLVLKAALAKFGIGRWVQIMDSGLLPGKLIQQLNGQTQRLLGQQSLAGFTGLQVDIDRVREDNEAKTDVVRKSGLIINAGGIADAATKKRILEENKAKYGLTAEQIDAIVLPAPAKPAHATATMERQVQAGGFRAKGKGEEEEEEEEDNEVRVSLMTVDPSKLSAGQCLSLLEKLHERLQRLLSAAAPPPPQPQPVGAAAAGAAAAAPKKRKAPSAPRAKKGAPGADVQPRAKKGVGAGESALQQLIAFGFPGKKCEEALSEARGDMQAATEWLLANMA